MLGVSDNLANVDGDQYRWRFGHVAELVEGCLGFMLRWIQPFAELPAAPKH